MRFLRRCCLKPYERHQARPDHVRQAGWAILACRTARLGGHVQACPDGPLDRVWYNSCRHRMGPPCAWLQIERWLLPQKARRLACEHDHVICTMPDARRGLWLATSRPMTPRLCATGRETRCERLGDATSLGAQAGIIAALHTWSQTLVCPPPLHGLVPGGGLTDARQWRAVRHGFLLPVRVVMAVFRGKRLAALREGLAHGQLTLPAGRSCQQLAKRLNQRGRTKWHVHIRERYSPGAGGLTYLARYIRGGPLANRRLVAGEHGRVPFRDRGKGEGSDRQRSDLMPLPIEECIRRDLRHVPEPGTRVVRGSGLYAPATGEAVAVCRAQVGQGPVAAPAVRDGQTFGEDRGAQHPERCPVCGRRLIRRGVLWPASRPPPDARPGKAVA